MKVGSYTARRNAKCVAVKLGGSCGEKEFYQ